MPSSQPPAPKKTDDYRLIDYAPEHRAGVCRLLAALPGLAARETDRYFDWKYNN